MSSPSSRQDIIRNKVQGRGSSVAQQRANHRNTFINRLKSLRIQEIDKFRHISENELDYTCLLEIKKLLSNRDPNELIDAQEIAQILDDIEEEMAILEAEQFEREEQEAVEQIAKNLMSSCNICESLIVDGTLCDDCLKVQFNPLPH